MVNLMEGVVQGGTASRLRYRYKLMGEIAGKTGTTNDNADGWFIGYTPTLVAGIWTGAEDRQVHFQSITYGQGAHMSLPTGEYSCARSSPTALWVSRRTIGS